MIASRDYDRRFKNKSPNMTGGNYIKKFNLNN